MKRFVPIRCAAVAAILVTGFSTTTPSHAILYNVERFVGASSVVGSITTDGTLGPIGPAQITDFDLSLNDSAGTVNISLSGSTGSVVASGTALTASLTSLFFDFTTPGPSIFFQDGAAPNSFWCLESSPPLCVGPNLESIRVTAAEGGTGVVTQATRSGPTLIASVANADSAISEPGALVVFGLGLAGLRFIRRKRAA